MQKKDLSLYIHIPFCVKKCDYCDFLSAPGSDEEISYYIRNLIKEIRSYEPIKNRYLIKSIFFGGGTPSLLSEEQITEIMLCIRQTYEIDKDAEISIECNPGAVTEKKLNTYIKLGINRLSLGLQSANNEELKTLGRIHTYEDFEKTFFLARKVGFENINIDIMSAIPKQTIQSYAETLSSVILLKPDHISSYSLQLEEGTPFYDKYTSIKYKFDLPDEKTDRDMYKYTKTFLEEAGYNRYEISNYALPGKECKHNISYWTLKDYLGIGMSSASFFEEKRFTNPIEFSKYKEHVRYAYENLSKCKNQTKAELVEEFMFLGLRLMKGISINDFEDKFGESFDNLYGEVTKKLYEEGFLQVDNDIIKLTDDGIDISNIVLSKFLLG